VKAVLLIFNAMYKLSMALMIFSELLTLIEMRRNCWIRVATSLEKPETLSRDFSEHG